MFKYYDSIINVACVNFYTLSKKTNTIILENYKEKNLSHRCILEIARTVSSFSDREVEIIMSPLKFFLLKIFGHEKAFRGKWIKRSKQKHGIDIDDFIQHIEQANNEEGIFERIYLAYYKRK